MKNGSAIDLAHEIWAMAQGRGAIEYAAVAIEKEILAVIARAVAAEREACAQLCLSKGAGEIAPVAFLAAAIRMRADAP